MVMKQRFALLIALTVGLVPLVAEAQRKSPLADAPAIRKRVELRSSRLELGAGAGTTLNQDFFHSVFANVKLGFHFTDWLSLSAFGGFTVANMVTGFQNRVLDSLVTEDPPTTPRQPSPEEAEASMNKITQILGAQLEFSPFTGKYSLFGKLFAHYDFYAFIGGAMLNLQAVDTSVNPCEEAGTSRSCAVTGYKPGVNFGVGFHSYFNQFLALNAELRDIVAQNNAAGRDTTGEGFATSRDVSWTSHYMVSLNLVLYLPSTADISN
jgi:outer membrane beta-barrel protein